MFGLVKKKTKQQQKRQNKKHYRKKLALTQTDEIMQWIKRKGR